ncbi:hypothetical protein [Arthrobacter sp. NyZ413]|uniref:hypothetical protein n=1 Tax=Arthrobacter sp. NyZ413 TaxID=3144669 RepID=UPI003BF8B77C
MSTVVRSTTGTAPIEFDLIGPNQVLIRREDASQQIYRVSDLLAALNAIPRTAAEIWSSAYWHGTSHQGPLNDAIVEARNPYRI